MKRKYPVLTTDQIQWLVNCKNGTPKFALFGSLEATHAYQKMRDIGFVDSHINCTKEALDYLESRTELPVPENKTSALDALRRFIAR